MVIIICKICGVNETDNPDGICDDCKFSIISSDDIPPNDEDFFDLFCHIFFKIMDIIIDCTYIYGF